ncbi:N-acetyltransferase [Paracoccus sp. S1E-3]|uniref:GNAT family N-acetyltransferase n=1 Tax=Paracoccus sp. S1E-3 TaxID=2756130 RepID=UPI0015EFDC11|nr:GNAT family N-acetyltransferase [Paracoccus sp. S1E-3]MBA4492528.1 GNAT family N-acetyltransferase [Paracoccus sp. S1E-3]
MNLPLATLEAAFAASWPPARHAMAGAIRIGHTPGGGDRVNSASLNGPDWTEADIDRAIEIQSDWGQTPLFRLSDEDPLGPWLLARSWQARKPTRLMTAPVSRLTETPVPRVTAFAIWPPLAIQRDLWREQGIDAARQAVMDRVALPKAAILGRVDDRAAGVAFVAADGPAAVLHALEVVPAQRRKGLAGWMVREAAFWARDHGARTMLLAVTASNAPALALYHGLGFTGIGGYSYYGR